MCWSLVTKKMVRTVHGITFQIIIEFLNNHQQTPIFTPESQPGNVSFQTSITKKLVTIAPGLASSPTMKQPGQEGNHPIWFHLCHHIKPDASWRGCQNRGSELLWNWDPGQSIRGIRWNWWISSLFYVGWRLEIHWCNSFIPKLETTPTVVMSSNFHIKSYTSFVCQRTGQ